MQINFSAISFNRSQDLHYLKNSDKSGNMVSPYAREELYQCHLLKQVYCKQHSVRFHAIESEIGSSQEFFRKRNSSSFY